MSTLFHFQYVSLINPNSQNLLSHGYQVLFKINSDIENQTYLLCDVADKYGLALEIEKEGLIIIYRPAKKGINKLSSETSQEPKSIKKLNQIS